MYNEVKIIFFKLFINVIIYINFNINNREFSSDFETGECW
jgi:hypothetical protein